MSNYCSFGLKSSGSTQKEISQLLFDFPKTYINPWSAWSENCMNAHEVCAKWIDNNCLDGKKKNKTAHAHAKTAHRQIHRKIHWISCREAKKTPCLINYNIVASSTFISRSASLFMLNNFPLSCDDSSATLLLLFFVVSKSFNLNWNAKWQRERKQQRKRHRLQFSIIEQKCIWLHSAKFNFIAHLQKVKSIPRFCVVLAVALWWIAEHKQKHAIIATCWLFALQFSCRSNISLSNRMFSRRTAQIMRFYYQNMYTYGN